MFLGFFTVMSVLLSQPNSEVRLAGRIDDGSTANAIRELRASRQPVLVLSSSGGEEIAALGLGEFVRDNQIEVRVEGVCLSACAQYVMLASPQVSITAGSLVAFHTSSHAIWNWSRIFKDPSYRALEAKSRPIMKRTASLLDSNRLAMLERAFKELRPICLARAKLGKPPRIKLSASMWVPDIDRLRTVGVLVPTSWPTNTRSAARILDRHLVAGTVVAFGSSPNLKPVGRLRNCQL